MLLFLSIPVAFNEGPEAASEIDFWNGAPSRWNDMLSADRKQVYEDTGFLIVSGHSMTGEQFAALLRERLARG